MKTAAISTLKASLSEYLLRVKAGEEVLITERGKAIARIVPLQREEAMIPQHLLTLEKTGLARIGTGKIGGAFWKAVRPADAKGRALNNLLEERRAGR